MRYERISLSLLRAKQPFQSSANQVFRGTWPRLALVWNTAFFRIEKLFLQFFGSSLKQSALQRLCQITCVGSRLDIWHLPRQRKWNFQLFVLVEKESYLPDGAGYVSRQFRRKSDHAAKIDPAYEVNPTVSRDPELGCGHAQIF